MRDTSDNSITALAALKQIKRLTATQRASYASHRTALMRANPGGARFTAWGRVVTDSPDYPSTTPEVMQFLGLDYSEY